MTDADDRWDCCYVLVEDRSADDVAALLGGRLGDPQRSERQAAQSSAAWPAAGPAGGGWTVLVDPHFEFGDAQDEVREWSRGTRVVCLLVIERELISHAQVWVDGEPVWQVSFEGDLNDRPLVGDRRSPRSYTPGRRVWLPRSLETSRTKPATPNRDDRQRIAANGLGSNLTILSCTRLPTDHGGSHAA